MLTGLTIKKLWDWTGSKPGRRKFIVVSLLVIVVAAAVFLNSFCGTSRTEQQLETKQDSVTEQKANTRVIEREVEAAEPRVKDAGVKVREATKKAEAARNANTSNSSYEEANRNRCLAYPESKECQ